MRRRDFVKAALAAPWLSQRSWAIEIPPDARIVRVIGLEIKCQRSKVAGKNARLDVHGDSSRDRLAVVMTNAGVQGIGDCRMKSGDAAQLLGKSVREFFDPETRRFVGPIGVGTMPLWDLAGNLLGKSIAELLGGKPRPVPVYDGSIYFADLLPAYATRWQDRFRAELDMAQALGHRAAKIKIGRGAKWMPRDEGDARDAAVVRLLREHVGKDFILGVDANNGYDLDGTKRLFERIGDCDIAFAEEMFPEEVSQCLDFQGFLRERGLKTLVADGETQTSLEVFKPFMEAKAIDIYQGDMHHFGYEGILTEAAWAKPHGLQVAPHNWGHLVAFYMQLHVGCAVDNFYRAEHDPLRCDVLGADGYVIKNGLSSVPDAPGSGLQLAKSVLAGEFPPEQVKLLYDVKGT
ncbi:MAG: enolase C-terminal domain-like protein [Planctomycetota bacterium]